MPSPQRLVSLTPSNTELVAFLGLTERLVGVDDWSDWPPAVQQVERVGPDLQIDLDRVATLEPELVLASLSVPGMESVVQALGQRELPHVVLAPKSLAEVGQDLLRVGDLLGVVDRAREVSRAMEAEVARIQALTEPRAPVALYWEWWPKPPITPGGLGWMNEVMAAAGGRNVFGDRQEESLKVSLDAVAKADPDAVALCWQGSLQRVQSRKRLAARSGWEALAAVEGGRVLEMPEALYGRPGPRLVEGIRHLAARLHPDLEGALGEAYAWVPEPRPEAL